MENETIEIGRRKFKVIKKIPIEKYKPWQYLAAMGLTHFESAVFIKYLTGTKQYITFLDIYGRYTRPMEY